MDEGLRYYRFRHQDEVCYGVEAQGALRLIDGDLFGPHRVTDATVRFDEVKLLSPCLPGKIVAVGRNYRDHAKERGKPVPKEPLIFLKAPSAVIGPGETIKLPRWAGRIEYEGELAVVMGRTARYVPAEEADDYVLGVTAFNDVTARELQDRDVQFTRAKSFDTFAPMGPSITRVPLKAVDEGLALELALNGEVRQASTTADMLFTVAALIQFISRVMTLLPGDVIATGTPAGTGRLADGDAVEVRIENVGALANPVALE